MTVVEVIVCIVCAVIFVAIALWARNKDRHPPP